MFTSNYLHLEMVPVFESDKIVGNFGQPLVWLIFSVISRFIAFVCSVITFAYTTTVGIICIGFHYHFLYVTRLPCFPLSPIRSDAPAAAAADAQ